MSTGDEPSVRHDDTAHRFSTVVEGHTALLEYQLGNDDSMSITHTLVPSAIEGRGIGARLMKAALAAADAKGWSVVPVCSYAAAYMRRHRDRDASAG